MEGDLKVAQRSPSPRKDLPKMGGEEKERQVSSNTAFRHLLRRHFQHGGKRHEYVASTCHVDDDVGGRHGGEGDHLQSRQNAKFPKIRELSFEVLRDFT
jgi:hypothetical protein